MDPSFDCNIPVSRSLPKLCGDGHILSHSSVPCQHKVLRFVYSMNHYQCQTLPFGLLLAPRMFTKMLVVNIARLRS